jgi:hypothetical protein
MKVRLIEIDQEDNEGTLYNVLQIMHTYVMFENQIKNIKKVNVMINDYDIALQDYTKNMYIVTLFTDNNTYININSMIPSIEIKQIQKGEKNDKIIQVTSINFIKGLIHEISLEKNEIIFQEELPIQHDIHLYSNVCKANRNFCNDILNTNLILYQELNHKLSFEELISNYKREINYLTQKKSVINKNIPNLKYTLNSIVERVKRSKRTLKYLPKIVLLLIVVAIGIIVYKKSFISVLDS